MKIVNEPEKYFVISEFEEGWGMEEIECEEQVYDYCVDALFIPEEKIEDLAINDEFYLEVTLKDLESDDLGEDWYVNLFKMSK
ncbi:hypothetical protein [Arcobacter sp. LA11]|uniref:hypothetical protein n=1 Tax=Arcobacter sp. LA11 TaxID=1898176 RepID=UPI00157575D2|nr:hypothetical protein [Arcobacter sp. LA11]